MNIKAFVALFAVAFVANIGIGIVAPLMPLYAESMGASGLWLGIMFSGYAAAGIIFRPIAGRLSDVRDRKRFITFGLFAYTIISLLYAWAPNIIALTFVRFSHGIAASMVQTPAQGYIGDLIPKGKEGTYINLYWMSLHLGMGCGPLLGGMLTEYFFMDAAFYGMTAVSSIALCLLLLFVPPMKPHPAMKSKKGMVSVRTILRDSRIQASSVYRFSRAFWRQGIMAFLPLLALSTLQMTPASIGLVLSVYLLTDAGTQGLSGPLVDRSNKIALIAICSIIGSAFLFLVPHAHSGGMLLAVLLPFSMLSGVARGGVEALNVEMGREYRQMGTVMGIFMGAACLGQMSGPMVFGYTMDVLNLNAGFTIGATVGVIGGLVTTYLLIKWTTRQRAAFRNTK